jgi:hypothetical protein
MMFVQITKTHRKADHEFIRGNVYELDAVFADRIIRRGRGVQVEPTGESVKIEIPPEGPPPEEQTLEAPKPKRKKLARKSRAEVITGSERMESGE